MSKYKFKENAIIGLFAVALSGNLLAEDIEIYTANTESGSNFNVMFMTDTSGSMSSYNRMTELKSALNTVIGQMNTKVNVGLGRMVGVKGGAILEPIKSLGEVSNYYREEAYATIDATELSIVRESNNEMGIGALKAKAANQDGHVALRFDNFPVESNVDVGSGKLKLYPANTVTGVVELEVSIEVDDAVTSVTEGGTLISSYVTGAKETFSVTWEKDKPVELNIATLLENKLKESSWCHSNDLNVVVKFLNTNTSEVFMYAEESYNRAAHFRVNYLPLGDSCVVLDDETYYGRESYDDTGAYISSGHRRATPTGTYLTYGTVYTNYYNDLIGLRFPGFRLKGLAHNVNLSLTNRAVTGNPLTTQNIRIYGEISNHSASFTWSEILHSRSFTTAYVTWNLTPGLLKTKHTSPDVSVLIDEMMASPGYNDGDSMTFFLESQNPTQVDFYSMAGLSDVNDAPSMMVDYIEGEQRSPKVEPVLHQEELLRAVDTLSANGMTPFQGQQMESYYYFMGEPVGGARGPDPYISHESALTSGRVSDAGIALLPDRMEMLNYESPMGKRSCDINALVMLTDGNPTGNLRATHPVSGNTLYEEFDRVTGDRCPATSSWPSTSDKWKCSTQLAKKMFETDLMPDTKGHQNVITYAIGLQITNSNLPKLASAGGGKYYDADDASDLTGIFLDIIKDVYEQETSIAVPGIAAGQTSKYQNKDELYYSLFKPTAGLVWNGNVKRYRLDDSGGIIAGESFVIVDQNNAPAIDPETEFFDIYSQSFWSSSADGPSILKGGTVGEMKSNRKVYTATRTLEDNYQLKNDDVISELNGSIVAATYGAANDAEAKLVSQWIRGIDVNDADGDSDKAEFVGKMGAVIHSRPLVVNYNNTDSTMFISTTDGMLHGFDTVTGKELFAFVPPKLLPDSYQRFMNEKNPGENPLAGMKYGLDAPWVAYRHDANNDGEIKKIDGDFVYIYGGMRRGGEQYYALDVTNVYASSGRNSVKLKFILDPARDLRMANMGQTWSTPTLSKIQINNKSIPVMIFGGGYDIKNDDANYIQSGNHKGSQIYIVDAKNGNLLYSIGSPSDSSDLTVPSMNYSITAPVSVSDIDGDGHADVIYAVDLGGQVIRIDVTNGNARSALLKGKVIGSFGVDHLPALKHQRRFYEKPSLVPMIINGVKTMGVTMGSGYRSHPLNTQTQDGFFMLYDREVLNPGTVINNITSPYKYSDLYDVTSVLNETQAALESSNKSGYYIIFTESDGDNIGEKVLSEALVINQEVYFSTYVPGEIGSECAPAIGESRSYRVKLYSGAPVSTKDDGDLNKTDRYSVDTSPGMGSGVTTLFTGNGPVNISGTKLEGVDSSLEMGTQRTFWKQITTEEAATFKVDEIGLP